MDISHGDFESDLKLFYTIHPVKEGVQNYADELIRGTFTHLREIDELLSSYAENWTIERMAAVDRNVLRIAVYEMLFSKGVPPVVAINEAVDIAKKFSTPLSGAFVNGILDRIREEKLPDEG